MYLEDLVLGQNLFRRIVVVPATDETEREGPGPGFSLEGGVTTAYLSMQLVQLIDYVLEGLRPGFASDQ